MTDADDPQDWIRCPACGSDAAGLIDWHPDTDITLACPECETQCEAEGAGKAFARAVYGPSDDSPERDIHRLVADLEVDIGGTYGAVGIGAVFDASPYGPDETATYIESLKHAGDIYEPQAGSLKTARTPPRIHGDER